MSSFTDSHNYPHVVEPTPAHRDTGQAYRNGEFVTFCTCGREFTGQTPDDTDAMYVEHASDADPSSAQQATVRDTANGLLAYLDDVVPPNVVHYAVEEARVALRILARKATTVRTTDTYH